MININIDFGGDIISLVPSLVTECTITGNGTLTADYVITTSGTLYTGDKITFYYQGEVDKDTYDFTLLGTNLSTTQLNRESTIVAIYNGSTWDLNVTPNTRAANWVSINDLPSDGSVEVIVVPVSFEAGEQCYNRVFVPYGFDLLDAWFHVTKAIAGTDDGSITIKGDTVTLRTINVPASTGLNIACASVLVSSAQTPPESNLDCITLKTTAGGKGLVSLVVQRYE